MKNDATIEGGFESGEAEARERTEYLLFACEGQHWLLATRHIERVFTIDALTPVPLAPKVLAGLVNLGGIALPVIDLNGLLGEATPPYLLRGFYGLALANRTPFVALLARRVLRIEALDPAARQEAPNPLGRYAFEIRGRRYLELEPERFFPLVAAQFAEGEEPA